MIIFSTVRPAKVELAIVTVEKLSGLRTVLCILISNFEVIKTQFYHISYKNGRRIFKLTIYRYIAFATS